MNPSDREHRKIYSSPPDTLGKLSGATRHGHEYIKICASGAAETGHCGLDVVELGKEVGRAVADNDAVLTSGATTGFPLYAAMGVKENCGFSIGFSPASTEREHVETYQLPLDYMDVIVYTGFGYPGRDLMLTRSSDAVVIGCGRIGTFHEFTIAFEDRKPIGVLEGSWETDELIRQILAASHRPNDKIIFDSDPKALVERLIEMVKADKAETMNLVHRNDDMIGGYGRHAEPIL
ncbi:MAG TPA: hypothetical protein VFL98_03135 [Candidatus Paceibacterota bacterium]|nr:hypothetical protein [Candidatus Paceibacterota bacterium]